jgi:hypothetical protein
MRIETLQDPDRYLLDYLLTPPVDKDVVLFGQLNAQEWQDGSSIPLEIRNFGSTASAVQDIDGRQDMQIQGRQDTKRTRKYVDLELLLKRKKVNKH